MHCYPNKAGFSVYIINAYERCCSLVKM